MIKNIVAAGLCIALSGCVTGDQEFASDQQAKMTGALAPWIGRSLAEYVASYGPPTSSVKLDSHTVAFRWTIFGQGAGAAVPVGSTILVMPPRQMQCTVVFTATSDTKSPDYKDYQIVRYQWEGNC